MKGKRFLVVLLLLQPTTAFTQNIYRPKDLAFAQIAAGGGYETVLNLTNRGTTAYTGTFTLFQGSGQPWSPLVNGNLITNGKMDISLGPGATDSIRISLLGTTESGFGTIKCSTQDQTSFLEGTLTYYLRSGRALVDSIGVQPSSEIYLTTIPFDDFSTIALALANANTGRATAQLTLFSEKNA